MPEKVQADDERCQVQTGKPSNELKINKDTALKAIAIVAAISILANMYMISRPALPQTPIVNGTVTPFEIITITDARCAECDVSVLVDRLKQSFPNADVKVLDYSSAEGRQLYDSEKLTALPAVLVDKIVQSDARYNLVAQYLTPANKYLSLAIGATWDPYCDATPAHCSEAACSSRMNCRVEKPGQLDLFVMSQCPYGVQALNSMKEVLDNVQGLDFRVHYIADYDGTKFISLHGDGEVAEDIRELCAMNQNQRKGLEYIWCRNKDLKAVDWQACATTAGLDVPVMKNCYDTDEGAYMLREDLKLAKELNVGGSPTFLANNKKSYNALTAEMIKQGWCTMNQNLDCKKTLTNDAAAASGGGCAT